MPATIPFPLPSGGGRLEAPVVYVPPSWEYRTLTRPLEGGALPTEAELNALGGEGWELAGVVPAHDEVHFYFKRLRA